MTTFTFSGITPHTITVAPLRGGSQTPGTIVNPVQWTLNPATGLASFQTQNPPGNNAAVITPNAGANGTATLTVNDVDENGSPISASAELVFTSVTDPTTTFTFTES